MRVQLGQANRDEDHRLRSRNHRGPDAVVLTATNAYAIGGFALTAGLVGVLPVWLGSRHLGAVALSFITGGAIFYPSWKSHGQRAVRRRIYHLLERRIVQQGFRPEHFRHLCGGACLRFQHRLLFRRHGVGSGYRATMKRYRGQPVVYFAHPNAGIEDELNFGHSADLMRQEGRGDAAGVGRPEA